MSKKDVFGDDVLKNKADDFAFMFEESMNNVGRRLKVGDSFSGEVLSIGKEEAFIATATTQDALILIADLLDENKELKYKVGDRIDVTVVNTKGGEIRVAKKGSKKSNADLDSLEDAYDMELPIEGRVIEVCNGGFKVQVNNKVAFCPVSQLDYKVDADHSSYINKKFDFIITQFDPKGRNIVVSRKKLLTQQKFENEGLFIEKAKVGDIYTGKVTRIEKFGAFIQIEEGIEGLCHISEIGWSRLQDPSEVLSVGQTVQVKLIDLVELEGKLKISLSVKQAGGEGDPWLKVPEMFPVGSRHEGMVEKKEQYGLFVNIAPGVTGLLPRSKWRDHLEAAQMENKKKGDKVIVQIDEILFDQKKIAMGLPSEAEDLSWKEHTTGKNAFNTSGSFGALASLLKKN